MKALIGKLAFLAGALRGTAPRRDAGEPWEDPSTYETGGPRWAEPAVAALLVAAGALFTAFAVLLAVDADPQLLGGALGFGLAALAAALILAAQRVAPRETAVEDRPVGEPERDEADVRATLRAGADGVSRRGLLAAAAGTAATGAVAAAALPLTSLGPSPHDFNDAPWRAGKRLVDEDGRPIKASMLEVGGFLTAFPEGADPRELGSPVVVVRVHPEALRLPRDRRGWAPQGIMAYSKICTHAGCAVSLFRKPTDPTTSHKPAALVCPCHYSTFAVEQAAKVVFGPASRPLPQLPLRVEDDTLLAAGPLSGSVGPAWWGTKGRHA